MGTLRALLLRLTGMFGKDRRDRELADELENHLQMHIEDNVRAGMSSDEARRRALLKFGGVEQSKENYRDRRGLPWLETLLQDVRFGVRTLRKNPGFTVVAVLTLALGTGANTAIFSLINTLMLNTLPVNDPRQLIELLHRYPGEPHLNGFSWQAYQLMRDRNHVFSGMIADVNQTFHVSGGSLEPGTVEGGYVDGTFFSVLGVKSAIGRLIGPKDDNLDGQSAVAVISYSFWKSSFNLDPAILGKQIIVEEMPVTIVGVTPRGFSGLQVESSQHIWLPLSIQPTGPRSQDRLGLVGRLKPGVSMDQAQTEMAVLFQSALVEDARTSSNPFLKTLVGKMKFEMEPAGAGISLVREQFATPLIVLMAMVSLLLLIACTNLAGLLLARGTAREHEMAVRVALGATRLRLVRQGLTESLLLCTVGSTLGILLAYFGAGALVRIVFATRRPGPPLQLHVNPDAHVLLFTGGVTLLAVMFSGLLPALRASICAPASSMQQTGKMGETGIRRFFGESVVIAQVALSVVLLSGAAMFVRYLLSLKHLNLGFRRDHVLLVTLDPTHSGYDGERLSRAYQDLLARLETIPGVRSATICAVSPIEGPGANHAVTVEGYAAAPGEDRYVLENSVAPKYFETLGTPLLAGRDFSFEDERQSREVIINLTMSRYYFGPRSPIGMHVTFDGDEKPYEIVGLVSDSKYLDIRESTYRTVYFNAFEGTRIPSQFALRTSLDPGAVAPNVRSAVRELLGTVPVNRVTTLADQVDSTLVPERLIATLSGWFGALSGLLVAVGLYGMLAYDVSRRTNEIGVRMALGARPSDVTRTVLGQALGTVCAGLAIGTPIVLGSKKLAASFIRDMPVNVLFPITFAVATMIGVALLAAYVPARRAMRVDPMVALRYE